MLERLSEKLQDVFRKLSGKGTLSEEDVEAALREVRLALLEADVNLQVVRDLVARLRERAVGAEVLRSLSPAQQVIMIVNEELVELLGGGSVPLDTSGQPPVIMLVGLQGSGKTTTAAKLALHLRRQGQQALLAATDVRRPAAAEQLASLGRQLDVPVVSDGDDPVAISVAAREQAATRGAVAIVDTQGRLHVDKELMDELIAQRQALQPQEVLLVADAMTGQEAVRVASEFHQAVELTGLVLTKMDGDARGGAALSMRSVAGVPIKFIGVGERLDALEVFHPQRMASRILGMGDVLTLVEKAQQTVDEEDARRLEKRLRSGTFDLEDFLEQLHQVKQMGPISQMLQMLPGMGALARQLPAPALDDSQIRRAEAIIYSMTPEERRNPAIIDGSRRRRIALGSGTRVQEVNQLLNQFRQLQKVLQGLARGRMPDLGRLFR